MGKDNLLQKCSTGMMSTNSLTLNIQLINRVTIPFRSIPPLQWLCLDQIIKKGLLFVEKFTRQLIFYDTISIVSTYTYELYLYTVKYNFDGKQFCKI